VFKTRDVPLTPDEVMTLVERESRDRKTVTVYELSEAASGVNRPTTNEVLEAEIIHGAPSPFCSSWPLDSGPCFLPDGKNVRGIPEG
jgi:hypothetical protein